MTPTSLGADANAVESDNLLNNLELQNPPRPNPADAGTLTNATNQRTTDSRRLSNAPVTGRHESWLTMAL